MCSTINNELMCFPIVHAGETITMSSTMAGKFPIKSCTGANHIVVFHVYTLNTTVLHTVKNREGEEMVIAFKSCCSELNAKGHHPTLNVLNNKCFRTVTYYNQRVNTAEHGCIAAEYYTITTLCAIDPSCPA